MPTIYLRPTPEQKAKLKRLADTAGQSENVYMLHLLDQVEGTEGQGAQRQRDADVNDAEVKRLTVRIPSFIEKAVVARAKATGMSKGRWVAGLVQSNLLREPVMSEVELSVLQASTRELTAIGRNLNQMTKSLHEHSHDTELVRLDALAALSEAVMQNRAAIRAVVRASQNAWEVAEWR